MVSYKLRKAKLEDIPFLLILRRQTMDNYLIKDGVNTSDDEHLKRIKFKFDDAKIIVLNGRKAGLFKASFIPELSQWHIFQLQILSQYQGMGIGSDLVKSMCQTASRDHLSVGLSVLKSNPAKALYDRLGFITVESNESEYAMIYKAEKR